MWKELVESLTEHRRFFAPALWADVMSGEDKLGVRLPDEIRDLLLQSNGIEGEFGLGLVWPIERIVSDNNRFRNNPDFFELYMPFDSLLFFGDAGNGDQFAYSIVGGAIRRCDVFAWDHENDSRSWVAPSLKKYVEWWLNGTIAL